MRIIRTISLALLAVAAFAGEAEPLLTVSAPDGAKSTQHFNTSVYSKVINSPEFAPLKAKLASIIDEDTENPFIALLKEAGINPLDLFTRLRFFDLALQGEVKTEVKNGNLSPEWGTPCFRAAFDLGEEFAQIAAKYRAKEVDEKRQAKINVPGTEEAYVEIISFIEHTFVTSNRTLRFGSQYVLTNAERADWQKPVKPVAAAHDLVLRWIPASIYDQANLDAAHSGLAERMLSMTGTVEATVDLVPAGLATHMVAHNTSALTVPVDKAVLARLPTNTLSAMALGIDGAAWWTKDRSAFFTQLGKSQKPPISAEKMEQNFNAILKDQGLSCSAAELVSGIKGTAMVALMQAAPFPTVAFAIPRSKALDEVVGLVLKQAQQGMPAEGAMAVIPLGVVPISLTLVRASGHWLVTSDTMLASTWMGAAPGGWLDTPAGKLAVEKAGTDAWMVGASDMAAEVRMYTGFLPMGIQMIPGLTPGERQSLMKTMQVLAQNVQPGWCTGRNKGGRCEVEITGLTGGLFIPAVLAGAISLLTDGIGTELKEAGEEAEIKEEKKAF